MFDVLDESYTGLPLLSYKTSLLLFIILMYIVLLYYMLVGECRDTAEGVASG